jgi:hypothetical protein
MNPPRKISEAHNWNWPSLRPDLARAGLLAIITILLWCTSYNRWTSDSWQTPLTYISDPDKGDVLGMLAGIRAARDGHFSPFQFTNIPELGAPNGANWDDYPTTEKPLICFMGLLARFMGIFAAANFAVMLGHVLSALSFYAACRILNVLWTWSLAGALVFAFSRYAFAHGLHHLTVAYYWHVPLDLVVCEWLLRGKPMKWSGQHFIFAAIVAFITGVQNVYYTFMFAQFVVFAGLLQGWRHGWQRLLPAAAILGITAGAFLLINLNTFLYHVVYGDNEAAVIRSYHWLEIYGLKLVDLVVPPPDHAFSLFAWWGAHHLKEVVLSPGELPPSGYLGLIGLAATMGLAIVSIRRVVYRSMLPLEAFLILWIIIYASVGGLNSVMGTLGFQLFRATTRYSIFILCIVLMYAVRRLSLLKIRKPALVYGLPILIFLVAWWDQTPPTVSSQDLQEIATQVSSDRQFTEGMEAHLFPGAMVFQIPIIDFPECAAPGVGSYDHFRPYLYSKDLRFSFGSDKGRPQADWQHDLLQMNFNDFMTQLENKGFSAIYVNRNGFSDKGASLIKALKAMGFNDMIDSDRGDLFCVFLKGK